MEREVRRKILAVVTSCLGCACYGFRAGVLWQEQQQLADPYADVELAGQLDNMYVGVDPGEVVTVWNLPPGQYMAARQLKIVGRTEAPFPLELP